MSVREGDRGQIAVVEAGIYCSRHVITGNIDLSRSCERAGNVDNAVAVQIQVALAVIPDHGRAAHVERAGSSVIYTAAAVVCHVADDPSARQVQSTGVVNAAAVYGCSVVGDRTALDSQNAGVENAAVYGKAAGYPACAVLIGVGDRQCAVVDDDVAVRDRFAAGQSAVDYVTVEVDGQGYIFESQFF